MKTSLFFKSLIKSCLALLITSPVWGQCTAVIYPTQTNTCSAVTFSAGNFNGTYEWDFGDGSTATYTSNATVYHYYYPTSGSHYTVTLNLYSPTNTVTPCSSTTETVSVNCTYTNNCQATFTVNNTASCYGFKFINYSSLPGANAYYVWDFGDGNTTTAYSNNALNHTYASTGAYVASLSVYTSTASTTPCSVFTQTVAVTCATCQSVYSTQTSTASCNLVYFHNQSTGGATYYVYDFGDGYSTTAYNTNSVQHTYASSNTTYTTSLTVYNSSSTSPCSISYQPVTISCGTTTPCAAAFNPSIYGSNCNMILFNNTSYYPGPGGYSQWAFGDGNTTTVSSAYSNGSVVYNYLTNGIYTATLSIYSSTASATPCSSTTRTLSVCGPSCTAAFTALNNYTASCNTYTYTNTSTAGPGSYYKWQFGDGAVTNTGSTASVLHTYTTNGVYTTTLGVYSSTASATPCSTAYQTVTVSCPTSTCQAGFTALNNYTASCNTYTYTNTSTAGPGAYYKWQFGDGAVTNMGSTASVLHTYTTNGVYTTTLGVYSSTASATPCSTAYQTVTVSCPTSTCQAGFTALNNYTASCNTYTYTNTSTAGPGSYYKWQFGDGAVTNMGSTASVLHTYTANGVYTTTLGVYSSTASATPCSTAYQTVTVSCITPTCQAAFTAVTNYTSSTCNTYTYTNTSTAGPGAYYKWQFGDGGTTNTGSTATIYHTYTANGVYTNTLGVYSSTASTTPCSTAYQTVTVSCITPTCQANSQFTLFADTANPGNYFAYNSSTGSGTLSYLWNFGDGNTSTQQYPFHQYATPGQYVVCLKVTSTTGTTSCTDTYCDSSSVHRVAAGFFMSSITGVPQAPTSLNENRLIASMTAYPNPMGDELIIALDLNVAAEIRYEITNSLGQTTLKDSIRGSSTTVNTSGLDHGFYFLSLKDGNGKVLKTLKLVK